MIILIDADNECTQRGKLWVIVLVIIVLLPLVITHNSFQINGFRENYKYTDSVSILV